MKLVTVSEAKSRLSALIEAAENGEEVLILRGSKPAVCLKPVSENDLMMVPELSDKALDGFDAEIEADRKAGELRKLGDTPEEAIRALRTLKKRRA